MKIAILGATSQIAKDLIISFSEDSTAHDVVIFSRDPKKVVNQFRVLNKKIDYPNLPYSNFHHTQEFDVILNFVGVGDPAAAKEMGAKIFEITEHYDNLALDYIKNHPTCKYIFMSSGAVYGGNFDEPVDQSTLAKIKINDLQPTDWYSIAKLYAEAKHRAISEYSIVDVRIFNYFSHTQDMNARFLITDIVRSIVSEEVLLTSSDDIVRDFITPTDFYQLVKAIINSEPCNLAVDAYTAMPIQKLTLLSELKSKYGLKYEVTHNLIGINSTGFKSNYYSLNRRAERFGYVPRFTSLDGIVAELDKLLDRVSG